MVEDDKPSVPQGRILEFNQTAHAIARNGSQDCSDKLNEGGSHARGRDKLAHAIGVALLAAYIRGRNDTK